MKKWYFSQKGNIFGPLNLSDARDYVTNNQTVYAWHPSFLQWKPCSIVPELADLMTESKPSVNYFSELIEKFSIRKQRLERKLEQINQHISANEENFATLDAELATYRKLTSNLSDGVKSAVNSIEQKKVALRAKQALLENAITISVREVNTLMHKFSARIDEKANIKVDRNLAVKVVLPSLKALIDKEKNEISVNSVKPNSISEGLDSVNKVNSIAPENNVAQLKATDIDITDLSIADKSTKAPDQNKKLSIAAESPNLVNKLNENGSQAKVNQNNFSEVKVAKFVSTDKKENNVVSSQDHTYAKPVISHLDNYSKDAKENSEQNVDNNQKVNRRNFPGVSNLLRSVFKVDEIKVIEPAIDENVRISKRFLLQTNATISTRPLTEFSDEELITKDRKAKRHRRRR